MALSSATGICAAIPCCAPAPLLTCPGIEVPCEHYNSGIAHAMMACKMGTVGHVPLYLCFEVWYNADTCSLMDCHNAKVHVCLQDVRLH